MIIANIPPNEDSRLACLRSYDILDSADEAAFKDITQIASMICDTPSSLISFVDSERLWIKASVGAPINQLERKFSICSHAILDFNFFEVPDTLQDKRFEDNPHIIGGPKIRFYAAAPLTTGENLNLGVLCVIDYKPRKLTPDQISALKALSRQIMKLLELRNSHVHLQNQFANTASAKIKLEQILLASNAISYSCNTRPPYYCNYISNNIERLLGFESKKWLSNPKSWIERLHPDNKKEALAKFSEVQKNGFSKKIYRLKNSAGDFVWIEDHFKIARNETTGEEELLGSMFDITEARKREDEMHLMFQILDRSHDFVTIFEPSGKIIYRNKSAAKNFKITDSFLKSQKENTIEDTLSLFHCQESMRKIVEVAIPFAKKNGTWNGENNILNFDDGSELIPVDQWLSSHSDLHGNPLYYSTVIHDLRQERTQQKKLAHTSKMVALGEMSAGIAHEINNPLTIIIGKTFQIRREMEKRNIKTPQFDDMLNRIEQTSIRISKIIHGLRSFSRNAEQDPFEIVAIKKIIDDTIDFSRERLKNHGIDLKIDEIPHYEVKCRPIQLSQVILNLLNNAHDAVVGLSIKWIKISCSERNHFLEIVVTDSGQGISQSVADKMMQPFFTTKEVGKGTGLGLSISKGIVEDHGGSLALNRQHKNTQFIIRIPRAPASESAA